MISRLAPVIDQGVIGIINLAVQLCMVRFATAADYGVFVIWQSLVMVMVSYQDALIGMPLSLRIGYEIANRRRFVLERQVASFTGPFVLVSGMGVLVTVTIIHASGGPALEAIVTGLTVALFAATFLAYYALRYLALSRADFVSTLLIDVGYAIAGLVTLAIAVLLFGQLSLPVAFVALSLASLVAIAVGLMLLPHLPRPSLRNTLRGYARIWRDSRWSMLANTATELQNRAPMFIIAVLHGPVALAVVFASTLVLRHLLALTLAWVSYARPTLVTMRDHRDARQMASFVGLCAIGLIACYAINLVVVRLAWPLVEEFVFADKFADMWPLVSLWTFVYVLSVPVTSLGLVLTVLGRYRDDFNAWFFGSMVSVIAVSVLAVTIGPRVAVAGMALGYVVTIVLMSYSARDALGALVQRPTAARTTPHSLP